MTGSMATHYAEIGHRFYTACGKDSDRLKVTNQRVSVTCKMCLSKIFKIKKLK